MSASTTSAPAITWRRLQPRLWVGRLDDRHVGAIEQGRRFTYIEPSGAMHPGFPTLDAAQEAATGPCAVVTPAPGAPRAPRLLVAATAFAAVGTLALGAVGMVFAG